MDAYLALWQQTISTYSPDYIFIILDQFCGAVFQNDIISWKSSWLFKD